MLLIGNVGNLAKFADILCCISESLPKNYLGMPLGASLKVQFLWNLILVKMEWKLSGWKKLSLFNEEANNAQILKDIFCGVNQMRNSGFLWWHGIQFVFSLLQVVWGFGRWDAFLGNWLLWFGNEAIHFWRWVIAMKYGEEWGGWALKSIRGTHGCSLWRSIQAGWDNFLPFVFFKDTWVRLWLDIWCENNSLKELHHDLYAYSVDMNTLVHLV